MTVLANKKKKLYFPNTNFSASFFFPKIGLKHPEWMIRFQKLDTKENVAKIFSQKGFRCEFAYKSKTEFIHKHTHKKKIYKIQFQVLQFAHSVKFIGLDSSTRQGGSIKKTSGSTRLQTWQIVHTNDIQIFAALYGKSGEWGKSSSQR